MDAANVQVSPVTAADWPDLERLFEAPGGPKYCWCMAWVARRESEVADSNASRKAALRARVTGGTRVGLLAREAGEPVGWCAVAPRPSYRRLGGLPEPGDPEAVWSVVCFFVPRRRRGQGFARALLAAAITEARAAGARVLEAYPVTPDSPSYRFMGFVSSFEAAGFAEVARAGNRRHVMRLAL